MENDGDVSGQTHPTVSGRDPGTHRNATIGHSGLPRAMRLSSLVKPSLPVLQSFAM